MASMLAGELTETWRLNEDKDITVDDVVECIDKKSGKAFGKALVNEVHVRRFGELDMQDPTLKTLQKYYGTNIEPNTHVKIISFTFRPYKQLQDLPGDDFVLKADEIKMYADGGSRGNPGPSASGYVLLDMSDNIIKKSGLYLGITTNNQAEYQALRLGLEEAKKFNPNVVHVYMDSLLVINQMKGVFKVKNRDLWPIYESIKELAVSMKKVNFTHVPREFNKLADAEVNETLDAVANKN